jgi:hypothetical protein
MMLKRKSWSVDDIIRQIHALSRECSSPYNDGFTSFECKKDLYQIQESINNALQNSPNFGDQEKQWLTEQEQKRIIKHLKS